MINLRKLESELWESADLLRAESKLTSQEYCMPVLGLIFLRYAYSRFRYVEAEIMKDRPDGDRLGEIVEIMLDAVCSTAPTIRMNGEDMPQQVVKSRFLKLDSSHIEYVFHAMKECPSNIRNIRAYLLTTLYNAPATMDNFYSAKVNHDFNGW